MKMKTLYCHSQWRIQDFPQGGAPTPKSAIITGRNEVVAKVMFLQMSVCPQGGRVSASVHAGMPTPQPPSGQACPPGPGRHPPGTRQTPQDQADTPLGPGRHPPGSRLQLTVYYEWPVRILLECILVFQFFPENCMKMKEFGPLGGHASLAPPLDPPMIHY